MKGSSLTVYGLYYMGDTNDVRMVASSAASAKVMVTMFGPAWKARKLTAAEAANDWVVGEVNAMKEAGVW